MLDIFQSRGHVEIDTAIAYTAGTSEEFLGKVRSRAEWVRDELIPFNQLDWQKRGLVMDTKLYPNAAAGISHSAADVRKYLDIQLKSLHATQIDMWYLHAPDRSVPFEETLAAVDELYKEGKFKRFGLSNYMSWEVAQIVGLCDKNGWIKPTAYQGIYNAIHRNVEPELFPCLRKLGLAFYEFNPRRSRSFLFPP